MVTGATGYVGGRLVPRLLADGHDVVVLVRSPEKLDEVPWRDEVEVVQGDLDDLQRLRAAMVDVDVVYHLVHSMGGDDEFGATEQRHAEHMATAAGDAHVGRIVYLGGLHPDDPDRWSRHIASRVEVGRLLARGDVPTFVLQAGIVIGAGSASFELLRHLTDRLPVMTTPRWIHNRVQPISIRDAVYYLAAAAIVDLPGDRQRDIGGPEVMTYGEVMQAYAEVADLPARRMIVLRPLSPGLASRWIRLVTEVPPGLARPLLESLACDAVVDDSRRIDDMIAPPPGGLQTFTAAVREALYHDQRGRPHVAWDAARPVDAPAAPLPNDVAWAGEMVFTDRTSRRTERQPDLAIARTALVGPTWQPDPDGSTTSGDDATMLRHTSTRLPGELRMELRTAPVTGRGGSWAVGAQLTWIPRGLAGLVWWPVAKPWRTRLLDQVLDRVTHEGC